MKLGKYRWVFLSLALVVALIGFWMWRRHRQAKQVAGIYLSDGGLGCMAVETGGLMGLRVRLSPEGQIAYRNRIGRSGRNIILSGTIPGPGTSIERTNCALLLAPSPHRKGDWDLIGDDLDSNRYVVPLTPTPRPSLIKRALESLKPSKPPRRRLKQPIPYFHRVDDRRVVECFDIIDLLAVPSTPKPPVAPAASPTAPVTVSATETLLLDNARAVLRDHPDDLHVRCFYLFVAAFCGESRDVAQRLDEWRAAFDKADAPDLDYAWNVLENWSKSVRLSAQGRNAYDWGLKLLDGTTDLETLLARWPEVFQKEAHAQPFLVFASNRMIPNFLSQHIGVKVIRVMATLRLIEGKREESLVLLASCFRFGQLLSRDGRVISALIGIGIKGIAAGGLQDFALSGCEIEDEYRQLWAMLERLEKDQVRITEDDLMTLEPPSFRLWVSLNSVESLTRHQVADARFELIRMATAARFRLVTEGRFPDGASAFGPLLPGGPPRDQFSTGPLRFFATTDALVCYSVGPDRGDGRAAIEYDPTNGTVSAGDITVRVPRERPYPFPREGLRAASLDDLARQLPNGLPPDPFATRRTGLSTTMTVAGEIFVFSYGPDVNQYKLVPPTDRVPLGHYDPTNGTISPGDLFVRVPKP
jgi:hypothetical protein